MANNFEEYKYLVDTFNKKYGTNFSFKEYDEEQRRFDNFSDNFLKGPVDGVSNEDSVYRKEFLKIYKQYAESLIFEYNNTFFTTPNYTEFINDFEDLMDVYRSYCSDEKRKAPSKLGGWKKGNDIIEAMEGKVNEFTEGFSNKYKDAFQHSWKKLKKQVKYTKINELENMIIENDNNNYSLYYTKSKVLILDFCRHFRNSFSHALTNRKQGKLFINDKKGVKNTCLGFVNYSDVKEFIIEIIKEYELRAND